MSHRSRVGAHPRAVAVNDGHVATFRISRVARPCGALVADHGKIIADRAYLADSALPRGVGMLGTPHPGNDEALVLVPCVAVHGVGLRAAIGAAFVDQEGTVLRVVDPLPWRGAICRGAHAVIEAATGVLALSPGDRVWLSDSTLFPHGGNFPRESGGAPAHPTR